MDSNIEGKQFLITGGAGFIGSNLAKHLLKSGAAKVRVLDNLFSGYLHNLDEIKDHPNFEFIEGDIRSKESCQKACEGVDYVFHQAALASVPYSIENPQEATDVNLNGFINILQAAKEAGVKRVVYASSAAVYGDDQTPVKTEADTGKPLSPYAITKLANELYAQSYADHEGLESVGLRYFNIFGPHQDPKGAYAAVIPIFLTKAAKGEAPTIYGDGMQTRDFVHIDDVVQANLAAAFSSNLASKHEVFNVAFGNTQTINQLWSTIQEVSGQELPAQTAKPREGEIRESHASIEKAKQQLSYEPKVTFAEGLEKTYQWYKQNNG